MLKLSVIILTFNSAPHITSLLDSLYKKFGDKIDSGEVQLILFDNASTDNTLETVRAYPKKIPIQRSEKNLGYGKGINTAAKYANGDIFLVINPDAKLISFNEEEVKALFSKDKDVSIVGFEMLTSEGGKEKNAGKFFNPLTFLLYSLGLENFVGLRFSPEQTIQVDFVSGGFVAFRKSFFDEIGGYDEDYFMYVEDMDICYRAGKMGKKVLFSSAARLEHKGQGSSSKEFAIVNIYKGLVIFFTKHKPSLYTIYVKSLLVIKALLIIFLSGIAGKGEKKNTYTKALQAIL